MEILLKYFSDFSEKQIHQLAALKNLYAEWNEKINVISRKDMDNFYEHHVLHSLAIATQFDFPGGYDVIDIGTGGGFPGIPLAIFFPEVNFHLADSINKKLKENINCLNHDLGRLKRFLRLKTRSSGGQHLFLLFFCGCYFSNTWASPMSGAG